ncbi:hypothetical protein [Streptomyces sp. 3214.6]|uniref:hypothetical protein n=1 Tax=Streptomyces sp. 3214.6 TaxID=1882757 RepID=UPI00090CD9AB|nr:hypothetical protein [Streptomyces sp. 3214.6]SHI68148.1 hypothetical protein SAMN05444521_8222 [Streptomyces sp. 3214.6]
MHDEQQFTRHAQQGWQSWDEWSPEQDFCRFVGMLQRMLQPATVLETGVGVGRITGHLDLTACEYFGFESNLQWRQPPADPNLPGPMHAHMKAADLVILDSDVEVRFDEIRMWAEHGKRGSVVVVHDAGNGHEAWTVHAQIGFACSQTPHPGLFLRNPRGSWMGIHA